MVKHGHTQWVRRSNLVIPRGYKDRIRSYPRDEIDTYVVLEIFCIHTRTHILFDYFNNLVLNVSSHPTTIRYPHESALVTLSPPKYCTK